MKQILGLSFGTVAVVVAVGCGGSNSTSNSSGGASGTPTGGSTSSGGSTSASSGGSTSASSGGGTSASSGGSTAAGGSTASGAFTTSVPASTPLNGLSASQLSELCSDAKTYESSGPFLTSATDYECKIFAVLAAAKSTTDSAARAACKASYSACKPSSFTADAGTDQCTAPPATCTATVGDLTACLNAYTTTFAALAASVPSCDTLTMAEVQTSLASLSSDAGTSSAEPTACTSYEAKCPDSSMAPPPMSM